MFPFGKTIKSTSRHASGWDEPSAYGTSPSPA